MAEPAREYRYRVDRDGRIFHDGTEVVDPAVLRFFLRAMTRTEDGRCLVLCQGERNWFEAPDTPFVIQRLRLTVGVHTTEADIDYTVETLTSIVANLTRKAFAA